MDVVSAGNGHEETEAWGGTISEILVADSDSQSGAVVSDIEEEFEEEEDEQQQQKILLQASAEVKPQAATSGEDYNPGDRLKQRTQMFILSSDQQ